MEKEFVPYEQSLDLKKLGFDEPCIATYNTDKKVSRNPSHNMEDLPIEGQPYYWQNSKIHISCITAPLYQQAFRWFREKYNLYSEIKKNYDGFSFLYYEGSELNKDYWINYILEMSDSEKRKTHIYKTYEEAELELLKKLIEIIKNK